MLLELIIEEFSNLVKLYHIVYDIIQFFNILNIIKIA